MMLQLYIRPVTALKISGSSVLNNLMASINGWCGCTGTDLFFPWGTLPLLHAEALPLPQGPALTLPLITPILSPPLRAHPCSGPYPKAPPLLRLFSLPLCPLPQSHTFALLLPAPLPSLRPLPALCLPLSHKSLPQLLISCLAVPPISWLGCHWTAVASGC